MNSLGLIDIVIFIPYFSMIDKVLRYIIASSFFYDFTNSFSDPPTTPIMKLIGILFASSKFLIIDTSIYKFDFSVIRPINKNLGLCFLLLLEILRLNRIQLRY